MNALKSALVGILMLIVCNSLLSQTQRYKGYPDKSDKVDVFPGFVKPPKGYGNVPFYWWNGDSLDINRIKQQLDILESSATDGFAVSYIHLDPSVDIEEMKDGYGLFGKTEPGRPKVYSEEWWIKWKEVTELCAAKGMGLGMDDYTVGWEGNGYYTDELKKLPKFANYKGKQIVKKYELAAGAKIDEVVEGEVITAVAYPDRIDLTEQIKNNRLIWTAPVDKQKTVYVITAGTSHLIHPDFGKELVAVYFDRYEKHVGKSADKGMNYFFQDELYYPIGFDSWSEDFTTEFKKHKGYDIRLYLPGLKDNIGAITPKIRLDFSDVLMNLAEERYFKPVYDWNASRGLIYGCDNLGRGMEPIAYLNYFRAISWFTAPGNDAPSRGSSFIQTKVSSSIAHMYDRPRTWLEAFHSMGWGSSGSWLSRQIDHHIIAGGNLVCMHGLYYSTHGGWWEWAPPCFHFRMPYWPHMKKWLEYTERLSYLLSQGRHVCDIVIMYPVEPKQAYPDFNPGNVFKLASDLSNVGLDYDFIDSQSLKKSTVSEGILSAGTETYKVIIMADMKAMHHATLEKVRAHYRAGGVVIATGELPAATDKTGEGDVETDAILKELFGLTHDEAVAVKRGDKQRNASGGTGWYLPADEIPSSIRSLITADFAPESKTGKVLHRKAGKRDIYMVTDVPKGTEVFFRSVGKVEVWNANDGTTKPFAVNRQSSEGTWLTTEHDSMNSCLYVFSPGEPETVHSDRKMYRETSRTAIDGTWETELLPTMDNSWGDFRFPASKALIGAEARSFKNMPVSATDSNWMIPEYDDSSWPESIYGFGPQATLYVCSPDKSFESCIEDVNTGKINGEIYEYSWQYGVWDNPGSQGYHGLKGKVSDGFFILNKAGHMIFRTSVYVPADGEYRIETDGVKANYLSVDNKPMTDKATLKEGWHPLVVGYANTKEVAFTLQGQIIDKRDRSAVVFYPASAPAPVKPSPYDTIIATKWFASDHLTYDPLGGKDNTWAYRFKSVPGLTEMEFIVAGKNLNVWFDGKALPDENITLVTRDRNGMNTYKVNPGQIREQVGTVAFTVDREAGYQGAAVICEPVKLKTSKGLLQAGDWSKTGSLLYYSGGMYYRKQIDIPAIKPDSQIILDLGDIVATCEVNINGYSAGIMMSPPYAVDITKHVKTGNNKIEILVYSTLSNHYQTIPTPYRDNGKAGLIGPVSIVIKE